MGSKGYKDRVHLFYDMIFAKRYLSDWARYLSSRKQGETEHKKKGKISFFDPTPEESWEWWKYNQSR